MVEDSSGLDGAELAAWRAFLRAHAEIVTTLDKQLTNAHGLGAADFEVLRSLAGAGSEGQRMTELAREVLLSPSGLTRRLDGLVKTGYADRRQCPNDGRGLLAVLTDEGRRKLEEMRPTHAATVRSCFSARLGYDNLGPLADMMLNLLTTDLRDGSGADGEYSRGERQPAL